MDNSLVQQIERLLRENTPPEHVLEKVILVLEQARGGEPGGLGQRAGSARRSSSSSHLSGSFSSSLNSSRTEKSLRSARSSNSLSCFDVDRHGAVKGRDVRKHKAAEHLSLQVPSMQVGGSQEEDKETKKREAYINRHMNAPDRPPIIDERRLKTRQLQQQMANASHIDASADGPAQAPAASGGLPKSSLAGFSGPVVKPGVGYDGGSLQNLASERAKIGPHWADIAQVKGDGWWRAGS